MDIKNLMSFIGPDYGSKTGKLFSIWADKDATVSRLSRAVAMRDGILYEVGQNEPVIDMANGVEKLYIGKQVTNLITQPFSFNLWTKNNMSVNVTDQSIPANITANAYKIIADDENDYHYIQYPYNIGGTTTHTMYLFAKAAEYNKIALKFETAKYGSEYAIFNIQDGIVLQADTGIIAGCISYAAGWWYIFASKQAITTGATNMYIVLPDNNLNMVYSGNNAAGVIIYNAGVYAGTAIDRPVYIDPTLEGSAVTRLADTVQIP